MIGVVGSKGLIGSRLLTPERTPVLHYSDESKAGGELKCSGYIFAGGWPGSANVDDIVTDQNRSYIHNVLEPVEFATRCFMHGKRLLLISSGCIFNWTNDQGEGWKEDDAPNFIDTPYTRHKWESETIVTDLANRLGGDLTIFRIRTPFDGSDHPRNTLYKLSKLPACWHQDQSWTWLPDLARCVQVWEDGKLPQGVYHITQPGLGNIHTLTKAVNPKVKPLFGHIHQEAGLKVQRSCARLDSSKIQQYVELTDINLAWNIAATEFNSQTVKGYDH